MAARWRRVLFGRPLATRHSEHQRLPVYIGLPVFASGAISSVAYATEEVLLALTLGTGVAASAALQQVFPISAAIAVLLAIVVFSYRQTIFAYPNGGGSYIVAKDNLGATAGLTAGAALLIDYVLTVAVSIAAGVAAIVSAFPLLEPHRVGLCLGFILLLDNALKYSPSDKPVVISATSRGQRFVVQVTDSGPGLEPGGEEQVFQRFYRAPSFRESSLPGVGIGLAVCRGLVEAHHGSLTAANCSEGGAVFTLELPMQAAPTTEGDSR